MKRERQYTSSFHAVAMRHVHFDSVWPQMKDRKSRLLLRGKGKRIILSANVVLLRCLADHWPIEQLLSALLSRSAWRFRVWRSWIFPALEQRDVLLQRTQSSEKLIAAKPPAFLHKYLVEAEFLSMALLLRNREAATRFSVAPIPINWIIKRYQNAA